MYIHKILTEILICLKNLGEYKSTYVNIFLKLRQDNLGALIEIKQQLEIEKIKYILQNRPLMDQKDEEKKIVLEVYEMFKYGYDIIVY